MTCYYILTKLGKITKNLSLLSIGKNVDQWDPMHNLWAHRLEDHFGNNLALSCKAKIYIL